MHVLLGSTTIHNYNLLDLILNTPFGFAPSPPAAPPPPPPGEPPLPLGPPPVAVELPVHNDNPERWARILRDYTREHAAYVLDQATWNAAFAAHEVARVADIDYQALRAKHVEDDHTDRLNSSAWRIADLKALNIIHVYLSF
ncbi:unnamed protein product [Closterium sp. NIES-54]